MPVDYSEVLDRNDTKNWIDNFHKDYKVITIDEQNLKWMKKAFEIGKYTKEFSKLYEDELDCMLEQYKHITDELFDGAQYFIRSNRVSLKEGKHGIGPYTTFKNVIESMVSTTNGHSCIKEYDTECTIYLMKWLDNLDRDKEFRIFVYKNRITAISQQNLYKRNEWLSSLTNENIKELTVKIINYFDNNIKNKMKHESYVMDFALIEPNERPYFIEPNSFGKEYASGSSLFGWINDYDELYNDKNNDVSFRFTHI